MNTVPSRRSTRRRCARPPAPRAACRSSRGLPASPDPDAKSHGLGDVDGVNDLLDFSDGEHVARQALVAARQLQLRGRIEEQVILARQPLEEHPHRDQALVLRCRTTAACHCPCAGNGTHAADSVRASRASPRRAALIVAILAPVDEVAEFDPPVLQRVPGEVHRPHPVDELDQVAPKAARDSGSPA